MAFVLADRVKDLTTSTGTGTITLAGIPPQGFQSFTVIGNANTTYYTIVGGAEWEVGIGTYTSAGTTLSRDTVLSSSNAGSLVNFSAGTKEVFVTYPSGKAVVGNYGTVTASTPILDLSQTWNNAGVTFTGVNLNVTDTASATASRLFALQIGGADRFHVTKAGAGHFAFSVRAQSNSAVISLGASDDTILTRDAANTLAQRNGASAQAFNIYNTYTDASNYERGYISWASNTMRIGTAGLGTGFARNIQFSPNATDIWNINTAGQTLWNTDNTYDIGASGANRPRTIYAGTSINAGTTVVAGSGFQSVGSGYLLFNGRSQLTSPADGQFLVQNTAGTDFGRLQFGGTTSAFPALKRSGAGLEVRLADDSVRANFQANAFYLNNNSRITDTADGVIGLFNNAGTDFSRLMFGGTTNAFPALKRSAAILEVRLADDTAYAGLRMANAFFTAGSRINDSADGVIGLFNNAATDFGRLNFGGTTSSFPALKRSGSGLELRVADDSARANFLVGGIFFNSGSRIGDASDGVINLQNSAATDFTRLNFGGTTSSFPALARNTSALEVKLADNSGYADLNARRITGLGTVTMPAAIFTNTIEKFTTSATAATGTINLDAATQSCLYYTTNASANWTVNLRLSSTGSLNSALAIGESMTFVFAVTQGATAYYNNVVQVDATTSGVTTKWLGGAPTAGNVSSIDVYTYCVVKTAAATFTVFASQAKYA